MTKPHETVTHPVQAESQGSVTELPFRIGSSTRSERKGGRRNFPGFLRVFIVLIHARIEDDDDDAGDAYITKPNSHASRVWENSFGIIVPERGTGG